MTIEKVAVIGAGVMGAGIAAHVANAGIPVLLLDIVPEGAEDRNVIAAGAVKSEPPQPSGDVRTVAEKLLATVERVADVPKVEVTTAIGDEVAAMTRITPDGRTVTILPAESTDLTSGLAELHANMVEQARQDRRVQLQTAAKLLAELRALLREPEETS